MSPTHPPHPTWADSIWLDLVFQTRNLTFKLHSLFSSPSPPAHSNHQFSQFHPPPLNVCCFCLEERGVFICLMFITVNTKKTNCFRFGVRHTMTWGIQPSPDQEPRKPWFRSTCYELCQWHPADHLISSATSLSKGLETLPKKLSFFIKFS